MINPTFDAREYPLLYGRLRQNGVTPPVRVPAPNACTRQS
jgi:hypothetical protein